MTVMEPAPKSKELTTLLSEGQLVIGGLTVTLIKRAASRTVIGFFDSTTESSWLSEVCEAENFSQMIVTGTLPDLSDARLKDLLRTVSASPLFAGQDFTLCGTGLASAPVFDFTGLFESAVLVAFDPPEKLPLPESNEGISKARPQHSGFVFYDPFAAPKQNTLGISSGSELHWLKCIASNGDSLNAIWRMKKLQAVLPSALRGELDSQFYYASIRDRKDFRTYRIAMETALAARGKKSQIPAFRQAFRARLTRNSTAGQFALQKMRAKDNRPNLPGSWARLQRKNAETPAWPSARGNVWMLHKEGERLQYLSDRWNGVTMGYVEQNGITLAETPDVALGFLGLGDGLQIERPLARRFTWHATDARLDGTQPAFGPMSDATLYCEQLFAKHECLFSVLALAQIQPGIIRKEAEPGGETYNALLAQVAAGQASLTEWGKTLSVDRLRLSLLTGEPQTTEAEAAAHYAEVSRSMTADLLEVTNQETLPFVIVNPQAGTRSDGTSEIALAESRFDLDTLGLNAVVATPAYPWPLMAGMPSTPSPKAALLMDELSMLAIQQRQNNQPWHCPSLQLATVDGRTVLAQFASLDGLVLDDGPHGFLLTGADGLPSITQVEVVSDNHVRLELDADVLIENAQLAYAWGHTSTNTDTDKSANHGALRDTWTYDSQAVPGQKLYRYALPGRVQLQSGK